MILCIGAAPAVRRSMVFAKFTLDEVNRALEVTEEPCGGAIDLARLLQTLGQEAMVASPLGPDIAELVRQKLQEQKIPHHFIMTPPVARSASHVVLHERSSGAVTPMLAGDAFPPEVMANCLEELAAALPQLLPQARAMVLSHSFCAAAAAEGFLTRYRAMAIQAGVSVIQSTVALSLSDAARPTEHAKPASASVLVTHLADLVRAAGEPSTADDAALHPAVLRVAAASGATSLLAVDPVNQTVVFADTAGLRRLPLPLAADSTRDIAALSDALAAGYVCGLAEGRQPLDCAQFACAVASDAARGQG